VQYRTQDVFISAQVVLPLETPLEEVEKEVDTMFNFCQAKTAERVGLMWGINEETGRVELIEPSPAPAAPRAAAAKPAAASAPAEGATELTKNQLWRSLQDAINNGTLGDVNASGWYDNRESKPKPTMPDFKYKPTGQGLWLTFKGKDASPDWFCIDGEVI